jgi:acyl-CoA reductase-like NAD-dependent aldehyde dehydrogenase
VNRRNPDPVHRTLRQIAREMRRDADEMINAYYLLTGGTRRKRRELIEEVAALMAATPNR